MHVEPRKQAMKELWIFAVHGIGAPFFGGQLVRFSSNSSIEECTGRFRGIAPTWPLRPFKAIVNGPRIRIYAGWDWRYLLAPWLRRIVVLHGTFVDQGGWIELHGRFALFGPLRVWCFFLLVWTTVPAVAFAFMGTPAALIVPLTALVFCELAWWGGDRERAEISAFVADALRTPKKAGTTRLPEPTNV